MTLVADLILLALGIFVWLFGNRLWLLGKGLDDATPHPASVVRWL